MLLAETISPLQLAGGAMILSGVWLTSVRPATRRIGVRRVFRIPAKSPA
jgi:drug/metabolite transporter (DMT)-like permease